MQIKFRPYKPSTKTIKVSQLVNGTVFKFHEKVYMRNDNYAIPVVGLSCFCFNMDRTSWLAVDKTYTLENEIIGYLSVE